mgnify:CR=1 FL=1
MASVTATANGTAGGPYDVTASIAGGASVDFKLTNVDPYSIAVESGSPQEATITTAFANPLRALVTDENGTPIPGITVTFTAPSSGASGSFSNSSTTVTATTDANGIASVPVTANGTAGGFSVSASVQGPATPASFSLTNLYPDSIAINGGNNQQATINTNYPQNLSVVVKDAQGAGIPGMTVTFTAPGSGASGVFSNNTATITAVTNASGIASVPIKANGTVGAFNVAAAVTGIDTPVEFGLTNLEPVASSVTISGGNNQVTAVCSNFSNALTVTVTDVNGLVIANYPVTYTVVPNGGATGTFSNSTDTITTNTNASGISSSGTLTAGCTAGSFTVTAQAGPVTQTFNLTILQPDKIAITGGGTQSTAISTNFSSLVVKVTANVNGTDVNVPNATVTFTAPETAGDYPFVCTFPGHAMVMNGVMTVSTSVPPIKNLHYRFYVAEKDQHITKLDQFASLKSVEEGQLPAGKMDIRARDLEATLPYPDAQWSTEAMDKARNTPEATVCVYMAIWWEPAQRVWRCSYYEEQAKHLVYEALPSKTPPRSAPSTRPISRPPSPSKPRCRAFRR